MTPKTSHNQCSNHFCYTRHSNAICLVTLLYCARADITGSTHEK